MRDEGEVVEGAGEVLGEGVEDGGGVQGGFFGFGVEGGC